MSTLNNIKTRNELAYFLNFTPTKLAFILFKRGIDSYYKEFQIPKKSGGFRQICASKGDLKYLQRQLAYALHNHQKEVFDNIEVSHAFEKGKSIITNAKIHRNRRFILNIDLKDFFDSFHFGRVLGFFEKNKYYNLPHEVAVTISQLACYNGKLPQGAPSSPIITNLICQSLDIRILTLSKKYKLNYTRYADDLTFSTNDKSFLNKADEFYLKLNKLITKAGFSINEKKTRLTYCNAKQTVTGLVVNKKINIDRLYYRNVRAMAHSLYTKGSFFINGVEGNINQLEGKFAFIDQIDRYNNRIDNTKHNFNNLSGQEKQYQKFLFFRYFFDAEKPTIITEGKTDTRYIKAALKKLYLDYPSLIEKNNDGKFIYKINFFKRSNRLYKFFNLSKDGADAMTKIYDLFDPNKQKYLDYFLKITNKNPNNPIILLFDNEMVNNKPLHKFVSKIKLGNNQLELIKNELFCKLIPKGNLYLLTIPLYEEEESEIENLFDETALNVELSGKKFSLNSNFDNKLYFGKDYFSKYVLTNWQTINFDRFRPFLDTLSKIVQNYNKP